MRIAVIGEGVIDRFLLPNSESDVIGGSGLNTAIAAKLAGLDTYWLSLHSEDRFGQDILDYASKAGVLPESPMRSTFATPLVEIRLRADGSPSYEFHMKNAADWQWTDSDLKKLSEYDIFHLTSLSAVLRPGSEAIFKYLQTRPASQIISYDPNARPSAISSEEQNFVKQRIEEIVQIVNIVKVSDEDLRWLSSDDIYETALRWSTLGPVFVIMTSGENGATLFANGEKISDIPGVSIDVLDTVGAGDTLMGWILRCISMSGGLPTSEQLIDGLQIAVKAAAITCSRQGCRPPTESEVLER